MGCGPPDLDRGWFYYGLLDCAAQLSGLTDPNTLHHKGILDEMKDLIFKGESPEYRWKAVSISRLDVLVNNINTVARRELNLSLDRSAFVVSRSAKQHL